MTSQDRSRAAAEADRDEVAGRWGEAGPMRDPELLARFRPRPTDVLIATAPKCGTTWMQQILHQIRLGGGDDGYATIYDVVPWLEAPDPETTAEERSARYEAIPDPRVFKTHCHPDHTPGLDTVRLVLTFRDPRDACVSMFHHQRDLTAAVRARHGYEPPATTEEHLREWLTDRRWHDAVGSWWAIRDRPNLLWLRYEDLVADLASAIEEIAAFLGWSLPGGPGPVAERSSFRWMRKHWDRFARRRAEDEPAFERRGFIRKGEPGDWRNHLTAEQGERVLAHARRELPDGFLETLGYGGEP